MSRNRLPTLGFALLAVLGCAALVRLVFMVPNPPSKPIADAINTNDQRHVGVVVKVELRHQFENGAITESWLMRADDGVEIWFARTNLPNSELVWRKRDVRSSPFSSWTRATVRDNFSRHNSTLGRASNSVTFK